jgi:cytochrome c556
MQRKILGTVIAAIATLGVSVQVIAETTPEDAKGYRTSIMTALKGHIGASSMTVRGLVDDHGQLTGHAAGLASTAAELANVFQEGSAVDDSEALPAIWEEPEKFAAAIAKLQDSTAAFTVAVEGGDKATIGGAFRDVGMSCRGCHDDFRVAHD